MIQSSRLPSLLLSALFALPFFAGPVLPSSLRAAEEKKIEFPAASQHSVVKQRVGLTDVEVDYSRPNKNDREIFGGLVPYGKLWRTGANAVTKIKFSKAVTLGGKENRSGAGEEPRRLLHALQEGADSGEACQQERSRRLGAKGDRHPEERQGARRVRDQERATDHRQLEVRINSDVAGPTWRCPSSPGLTRTR